MKAFQIVNGDISDGYHTFDELYHHRCLLFINLCLTDAKNAFWKPDYKDWFCLYWESPHGQISYHIPNKMLDLIKNKIQRDDSHVWDLHQGGDVIRRLEKNAIEAMPEEK